MAREKTMISFKATTDRVFIKLPASTRLLYFYLIQMADNWGIVNPYLYLDLASATELDVELLIRANKIIPLQNCEDTYVRNYLNMNQLDYRGNNPLLKELMQVLPQDEWKDLPKDIQTMLTNGEDSLLSVGCDLMSYNDIASILNMTRQAVQKRIKNLGYLDDLVEINHKKYLSKEVADAVIHSIPKSVIDEVAPLVAPSVAPQISSGCTSVAPEGAVGMKPLINKGVLSGCTSVAPSTDSSCTYGCTLEQGATNEKPYDKRVFEQVAHEVEVEVEKENNNNGFLERKEKKEVLVAPPETYPDPPKSVIDVEVFCRSHGYYFDYKKFYEECKKANWTKDGQFIHWENLAKAWHNHRLKLLKQGEDELNKRREELIKKSEKKMDDVPVLSPEEEELERQALLKYLKGE